MIKTQGIKNPAPGTDMKDLEDGFSHYLGRIWLELLDCKYQVFSLVTKFRALKGKGAIEFLSDYPLSVLDPNIEYSPVKALRNLRESLHRITIKSKKRQLNSLVMFRAKNPDSHFFHKNNDFLFLELPKYKPAFLYFYERVFVSELEAKDAAIEIIKKHYYCFSIYRYEVAEFELAKF